jgi:hypothetical protein
MSLFSFQRSITPMSAANAPEQPLFFVWGKKIPYFLPAQPVKIFSPASLCLFPRPAKETGKLIYLDPTVNSLFTKIAFGPTDGKQSSPTLPL